MKPYSSNKKVGMVNILPQIEKRWVIYQNSFTLVPTLDTDLYYSKNCINLALPILVPVLKFTCVVVIAMRLRMPTMGKPEKQRHPHNEL